MKKFLKRKLPFFIIIFLVFLTSVFYISKKTNWGQKVRQQIAMLSWKQFKSQRVALSFSYPSDWPLSVATDEEIESRNVFPEDPKLIEAIDFSEEFYWNAGGERLGFIQVRESINKDINEYKSKELEFYENLPERYKTKDSMPQFDELILDGEKALKIFTPKRPHSFANERTKYIIIKGGLEYLISFEEGAIHERENSPEDIQHRKMIFEKIISSLKFSD